MQRTTAFGKVTTERIIGLAEYLICTKKAPSWCGDWAAYRNPKIAGMSSQSVSELLCSLNRDKRNTFFRSRMEELEKMELKNICITLDTGYYSKENRGFIHGKGHDFIIPLPRRGSWQYPVIDSLQDELSALSARTEIEDPDGNPQVIQCFTKSIIRNRHRYYVHALYNPAIRANAKTHFIELLETYKKELEEKRPAESHQDIYDRFFAVRDTPKRERRITEKICCISKFQKSYAGYWCLLTNRKKPKEEIYAAYRQKNTAKIFSDTFKNDLNGERPTDHKLES